MAIINSQGFRVETFIEHQEGNREVLKEAIAADLAFPTESPQDMLADLEALKDVRYDQVAAYIANGLSWQNATREQAIALASLNHIIPKAATKSTITGTLTGVPGSTIPAGSRAATDAGDIFITDQDVTIMLVGNVGTANTLFIAMETGPVPVPANSLNNIITSVDGWTRIANATAGVVGKPEESTVTFKERAQRLTARNSLGSEEAMRTAIEDVEGVTHVQVDSNRETTDQTIFGETVVPAAVIVVVRGGDTGDVSDAIKLNKPMGISTTGNVQTDDDGYHFIRVTEVSVEISVDVDARVNSTRNVEDACIAYISTLTVGEEADNFNLGVAIKQRDSLLKINAVTYIRKTGGGADVTAANSVAATELLTLTRADVAVT